MPSSSPPVKGPFAAWARFVLRFRYPLLLVTLALTAVFGQATAQRLEIDTSVEAFLATKSDAFATLEELRDDFGRDEMFVVIAEGEVFSLPFLTRLKALHEELSSLDMELESLGKRKSLATGELVEKPQEQALADDGFGDFGDDEGWGDEAGGTVVDETISIINARNTTFRGGGLVVEGLLDRFPTEEQLPALREFVLSEPSLVGRVVGKEGRFAAVMLRTDFMSEADSKRVHEEITRIVGKHQGKGFKLQVGGIPALTAALNTLILGDLGRMAGWAMGFIILIMAITFRHPIGILGPVAVVGQAVLWCFGSMALAGVKMTMISNILPAFILCVGIGDSVHILSVYRDMRFAGHDNEESIVRAVASTGMPVLFTTLTTCIGLLSFRIASVDAIRDMGTFGAFGVAIALVHSLVFLPAFLTFNRKSLLGRPVRDATHTGDLLDRFLAFCNDLSAPRALEGQRSYARRNRTLFAASVVGVLSAAGAVTLEVYHNPVSWIPDSFEVKEAFDTLDNHLGGTADLTLLIKAKDGENLRDRDLMLALGKVQAHALEYEDPRRPDTVGNVTSVIDVLKESNRAVHEDQAKYYAVPDTERGVSDMFTLFENAGPDALRRLATVDLSRGIMVIRAKWMDATSYEPLIAHIQGAIDEYVGEQAVISPTGAILNVVAIVSSLLMDLIRSFGTALVVITIVMVALLRDLRLGLISMVPNLLPVMIVMGFMGVTDIPIDLNTILLGSIAIGIAVDDTIHFLYQFKRHFTVHGDVEAAIDHSFSHAGRAIVTTSVILAFGFGVFAAAEMYNVVRFGLLISLTLVIALLVDLIFTPALLRMTYGDTSKGERHAPAQ